MNELIIDTAGKTWQFLGRNGETEVGSLVKGLDQQRDAVAMALGWLARENKIVCSQRSGKAYAVLTGEEQAAFARMMHGMAVAAPVAETPKKKTVRKTTARKSTRKTVKKG